DAGIRTLEDDDSAALARRTACPLEARAGKLAEEPLKLPIVGREDRGAPGIGSDGTEEPLRAGESCCGGAREKAEGWRGRCCACLLVSRLERRERVGIEHDAGAGPKRDFDHAAGRRPDAAAG